MARVRMTVRKTKKRTKKYGKGTSYRRCPNCGGDGRVAVRKK